MKNELERLKEMRAELDAKIDKLIKPEFELNRWYKSNIGNLAYFENKNDDEYLYGIVEGCFTKSAISYKNLNGNKNWTLATPTEVQEALEKEAVKKYDGVKKVISAFYSKESTFKEDGSTLLNDNGFMYKDSYVMNNKGIWATPIKTMTIDEIADDMSYLAKSNLKVYLKLNKSQIIEILNSI